MQQKEKPKTAGSNVGGNGLDDKQKRESTSSGE